jgi:CheY-like chemotaxis protein
MRPRRDTHPSRGSSFNRIHAWFTGIAISQLTEIKADARGCPYHTAWRADAVTLAWSGASRLAADRNAVTALRSRRAAAGSYRSFRRVLFRAGWNSASKGTADVDTFRVLYVDDDPDIREVVELSLALDPTLSVRTCASGAEAIACAPEWHPDIILCDVMMPVMSGPATLAKLRDHPSTVDTPVVFMTARAQTKELALLKSLGVSGVITKPFDPMTLAELVRSYLAPGENFA